jgi:hypothetical protein
METIFNVINPFFQASQWHLQKKENTICYKYKTDEFIINLLPKTNELEITVPLNDVAYKNTFNNYNLNIISEYLKMHLNYYHTKNIM